MSRDKSRCSKHVAYTVRMAKSHDELVSDVMAAVAAFQDGTDAVDEAAAARLGINRTDLRCLGILSRRGPLPAGQLATEAGLSTGATTTVIDRLARAGYVQRTRSEHDRRRVTVELTSEATGLLDEIWGPVGREAPKFLFRRDKVQLEVIYDFLSEGRQFQLAHAERIKNGSPAHSTDGPPELG